MVLATYTKTEIHLCRALQKTADAQENVRDIDDNEETCVSRTRKITTKKSAQRADFIKNEEFDRYHLWESL